MPDWLSGTADQFKHLSPVRQMTFVVTAVGSLAFFIWLSNGTANSQYRVLYRGLAEAEVAAVADALAGENISYRLDEGGTAILVPSAVVHEARIRVAARGLPAGNDVGFEIFDKGNFGVTDFVQKVNYRRALQGELARSVEQIDAVESARVQIAIPEKTVFLRKETAKVSASVVTALNPGYDLTAEQIRGIVHLVSSSIEGLQPENVTVIDNHGRMLAPNGSGGAGPHAPDGALAQQSRLEAQLEDQVTALIERTVGIGNVSVEVAAELDWTQIEKTEEAYDPDSQVARSEQTNQDNSRESTGGGQGVAGIRSNAPDSGAQETADNSGSATTSRTSTTVNYEITKVVSHTVLPVGKLKRLSIAVLVGGMPGNASGNGQEEVEGEVAFKPWDQASMKQFESLAMAAVGFSEERGDSISVINAPFHRIKVIPETGWFDPQVVVLITTVINVVGLLLALMLFGRFLVKPLAVAIESDGAVQLLGGVEGVDLASQLEVDTELEEEDEEPQRELSLQERVDALAAKRSDDSVKTIRSWMAG